MKLYSNAASLSKGLSLTGAILILSLAITNAQWTGVGTGGTGDDFNDTANWTGGIVNGDFSTITQSATILLSGNTPTLSSLNLGWTGNNIAVNLNGTGVIDLTGDFTYSSDTGAAVTIGSGVTLNLGAMTSTRSIGMTPTLSASAARLLTVNGLITSGVASGNGQIALTRGSLALNNAGNTFDGPIHVGTLDLQTGNLSYSSIGNVGGGASALGAPTTVANGAITLYRSSSFSYTGSTNQSSDRQLLFNAQGGNSNLGPRLIAHTGSGGELSFSSNLAAGDFSGPLQMRANTGATLEFTGAVSSNTANFSLEINNTGEIGTVNLGSATSSYHGNTKITRGTLEITKLANAGSSSSLGQSRTLAGVAFTAASRLVIGEWGNALTTLRYVGTGDSTDRLFTVGVGSAGVLGNIQSSGTGAIQFTNTGAIAYGSPNQTRTVRLAGTNTGNNVMAPLIADNGSAAVSVTKADAGKWILTGANTYSGPTTVIGGTLLVNNTTGSGTGTSNVVVRSGTAIGGSGAISGNLSLEAGANFVFSITNTLDLSGTMTFAGPFGVNNLVTDTGGAVNWAAVSDGQYFLVDGTVDFANVTHTLNNQFDLGGGRSAYFSNSSLALNVVPEPGTVGLLGLAGFLMAVRSRRRNRQIIS